MNNRERARTVYCQLDDIEHVIEAAVREEQDKCVEIIELFKDSVGSWITNQIIIGIRQRTVEAKQEKPCDPS